MNSDIQKLRALAVILVIFGHMQGSLFHSPNILTEFLSHFWLGGGVDLFFCISGFVISKKIVSIIDNHKNNQNEQWQIIKEFWIKRAFRLLPSAWFWMLFPLVGSLFFNQSGVFGLEAANLKSVAAIILYVANFAQAFGPGLGANGSYWSLALEEQFYFAFPFFLLFVSKRVRWLILLLAIIALTSHWPSYSVWRLDSIIFGVLLYFFSRSVGSKLFEPRVMETRWVSFSIVGILVLSLTLINQAIPGAQYKYTIVGFFTAILVFMASFDKNYILPSKRLNAALRYIGNRSYAIYLVHMPAYLLTNEIWNKKEVGSLTIAITGLSLIFAFSELSYRFIESPMRNFKGRREPNALLVDR